VVRRKACRGELPVSLPERIEILVLLASGNEGEDQSTALLTLNSWPLEELRQVLREPATPAAVLEFSATNLVPQREELGEPLLRNPSLPEPLREWLQNALNLIAEAHTSAASEAAPAPPAPAIETHEAKPEAGKPKPITAIQRTQRMNVVQKVKAALTGSKEDRAILIHDSNKIVSRAVMSSPKLTEQEAETYASMKDISDEALRVLNLNRKFMKLYVVVKALVNNPRTPIDIGLHLLPRVHEIDLKRLSVNRNVPDVIRHSADKMVRRKEEAAKPKILGSKI